MSAGGKRHTTATDVARRAGVSQSAVSRAFTPGDSIAEETRARIEDAARALGYRPNAIARTLTTGRSRIIGNVGVETGFLFAVLGRDNPGKVIWPPGVFDLATQLRASSSNGISAYVVHGGDAPATPRFV